MSDVVSELLSVIGQLSFARDLGTVMSTVRRAARRITGADGATFILRDGDQCYYAEEDAIAPLWKGRRFPMSACISGWVMLNRTPAVIEDIYADPRIPADAYRPTFVRSLAMVPVRAADPLAAIGAYWATRRRPTEIEVSVLQRLADATALALANVELYEGLQTALGNERAARAEAEAARREAEAASRAKDQLLMVVSHELRTPLMPILGWARALHTGPADPQTLARGLATIERNARLEAQLVDDLLDVSRIATGTLDIDRCPVDLARVVAVVLESMTPSAEAKGVRIEQELDSTVEPVLGDTDRLQQVVRHLVSNAIKFTPPGGRITVRLHRDAGSARITVADTGIGIAAGVLPQIFDNFRRADASTTRAHPGLGLGLALVRHLVELHGGRVEAASAGEGRGATFTVCLPCISRAEQTHPMQSAPA